MDQSNNTTPKKNKSCITNIILIIIVIIIGIFILYNYWLLYNLQFSCCNINASAMCNVAKKSNKINESLNNTTPKPTPVLPTPKPTPVIPTPKPTPVIPTPKPTPVIPTDVGAETNKKIIVTIYHMSGCGHCRVIMDSINGKKSEYEQLKNLFADDKSVIIRDFKSGRDKEADAFMYFPTITIQSPNGNVDTYNGIRNAENIAKAIIDKKH